MNRAHWDLAVAAIKESAPELREAGVLRIRVGDIEADLAPAESDHDEGPAEWGDPEPVGIPGDVTADAALWPGGRVPVMGGGGD